MKSRAGSWSVALLAALAYLPALIAAPGRMPTDSKLYLYLDPGRFMGDAASSFDPRQFGGWVPHQHIAYLWPAGPWFWLFDVLHVPDWIAHRLWIGTLMVAAGLGVRWVARLLGLSAPAALAAALVYQLSPYVLPYVSRTSVMLLPWAGLGWIVGFTIRATRRRTWGDPAAIALIVFTVGSVNATALAMIVPGPALWLVHAVWQRSLTWRQGALVAARVGLLAVPVCLWWIMALLIQGRFGAEVLPYSESLADVSLTATAPEVWRSLGYWLFYVRDPYAATTTESLRYLSSTPAIVVSYLVPLAGLCGLVFTRWAHRRFAALCVAAGAVLAVGLHPIGNRSPLMRVLAGSDDGGLALALRSSTRALPVMNLGLALLAGALVTAAADRRLPRLGWPAQTVTAAVVAVLAVGNLPALWNGAFVDPALERDATPPAAWTAAAQALDRSGTLGRVLQLPGSEFGAYRWGYTVDQPLPGLTEKPLITRDLLPLGSAGAMDLLYALDDRFQTGLIEPGALAPVARWLGVDTIWVTNDLAYDRFRTARPEVVGAEVAGSDGVGEPDHFGEIGVNKPGVAMIDERSLGDQRALSPVEPVDLYPVQDAGTVVRAVDRSVVVSGSGDGLVDLSGAGLLDGNEVVQYSASLAGPALTEAIQRAGGLIVTDTNRDQARHWRSSQDTTGYTESSDPSLALLRHVASDQRLPVFAEREAPVDPATQTTAEQVGQVRATATSYGEPFAYLPERRPSMAIDGSLDTAWTVGEHADPVGETLRLLVDGGATGSAHVVQSVVQGGRRITQVSVNGAPVTLDDSSLAAPGQSIPVPAAATTVDIRIDAVAGGEPFTAGAVSAVGFAEVVIDTASGPAPPTVEVVRPPTDAMAALADATPVTFEFSRLRSDPMNRWRSDPEPTLVREVPIGDARPFRLDADVRVDPRAADADLADLFGWPAFASSRLTGSIASTGVSAIDGDPQTSWITGFGEAIGATLTIDGVTQPVDRIAITQPVGGFSRITTVTVQSGDDTRTVDLVPNASGTASAGIDPPLPAGSIRIAVATIDAVTTIDRRYGDTIELPVAISDLDLPGLPDASPVVDSNATLDCVGLVLVEQAPQGFSLQIDGASAIDGAAFPAEPCTASVDVLPGARVTGSTSIDGVQVDRVVLSQPTSDASSAPPPTVTVIDDGTFDRRYEVAACPDGCWLVFGEGFNPGWTATGPDGSLGPQQLVDGGFNGWWLSGSDQPIEVHVTWTQQRKLVLSLLVSLLAVAGSIALVILDRRRHAHVASSDVPLQPASAPSPLDRRTALVGGAAWCAASGLLIAPVWALPGALAGLALVVTRRRIIPAVAALATLAVVALLVTVRERRFAPAPNGGWPGVFESWHRLAMFAVVSVLVAALVTEPADAQTPVAQPPEPDHRLA